jgi:carbon storage regulator CsrA
VLASNARAANGFDRVIMVLLAERLPERPAIVWKGSPAVLVLSRREGETLVFPELDVVLEVLTVKGRTTRLGVKAPSNLTVLRGELAESRRKFSDIVDGGADDPSGKLMHRIRNWLHVANLRMQLIRRYLEHDKLYAAAELLRKVLDDFRLIEGGERSQSQDTHALSVADDFSEVPGPRRAPAHRALLVEDNVNERNLLAGYLRTSGFQVETAGDGGAAIDYLGCQERPDFVLLDMLMPHCDGPTVLRRIRQTPSLEHLKVFAVSGSSPTSLNIPTGPGGVDRWFRKPVDPSVLVQEISRELNGNAAKPR